MTRKLTSRKLWAWLLTQIMLLTQADWSDQTVATIVIVASTAMTIIYVAAEAYIDARGAENTSVDEFLVKAEEIAGKLLGEEPEDES